VSMGALVEAYTEAGAQEEGVLVKLTPGEVDAIRAECQLDGTVKVSDQDILSGWWATLLERAGERLERIIYVINVCRLPDLTNVSIARFTQTTRLSLRRCQSWQPTPLRCAA
jgi:hypothetical protein